MRRAVFIDKDGTLVVDEPYNVDPARIRLGPGVVEGLRLLSDAGFALIVVSNQSGIARGMFTPGDLDAVEARLREMLAADGIAIDAFYWCPHHPDGSVPGYAVSCTCRKPEPGLLLRAASEHGIDLGASWAVGDILNDVEAGKRAGCRTVLVDNGGETEWILAPVRTPDHTVRDVAEAAAVIVRHATRTPATERRQARPHKEDAYG